MHQGFPSEVMIPGKLMENIRAMSAICVQIAIENVAVTHYALRIISRMTESIDNKKRED